MAYAVVQRGVVAYGRLFLKKLGWSAESGFWISQTTAETDMILTHDMHWAKMY